MNTAAEDAAELTAALQGRTIVTATPIIERPPPGMAGEAVEGVQLLLDNGSTVELRALGWHDIQRLVWTIQ